MNLIDIISAAILIGAAILIAAMAFAIHSARKAYRRNKQHEEEARAKALALRHEHYRLLGRRLAAERTTERRESIRREARSYITPRREYLDESIFFMPTPTPVVEDEPRRAPYCAPSVVIEEEPCRRERYTSGGGGNFGGGGASSSWDSSPSDSSSSSSDSSSSSSSD